MGCVTEENTDFPNLEVVKVSDESLINGNVLFCNKGKSLIVTSARSCHMYSVATGEHVKELFKCETNIVSCYLFPRWVNSIVALSESGELIKYDLKSDTVESSCKLTFNSKVLNGQKVPKFTVDKKFYTKGDSDGKYQWDDKILNDVEMRKFLYGVPVAVEKFPAVLFWASWSLNDEFQSHVSIFFCNSGKQLEKIRFPKTAFQKCYKNFVIGEANDKSLLFVGMGINFVHVFRYSEDGLFMYKDRIHLLGDEVEVTCLTLLPKQLSFATGDSRGLILVWKNILDKHPLKSVHNWHTVEIRDLAFSEEGVHLFSGGDENVLVKWSFLSNQKNFLPRLSSPICHISVAEGLSLVALSLADNEIYIIDSAFQKISVIKNYSIFIPQGTKKHNILTSDPRSDNLVLKGRPGHLQFLSGKCCKFLYSLDVCKANYMTGDKYVVNLEITHVKFSKSGSWLVTAEARKDETLKEFRLKFWQYDETKQMFSLNTNMELPHDENEINTLEISSDDLVATSGGDRQFKLWAPIEVNDLNTTKIIWSVLSIGKYKLLPCDPIDFSKDATLIAVGFGPALTIWSTSSCSLKCSLITPFERKNLKFIKFGNDEHSHIIVTATESNIIAWNVITLTIIWTVDLDVSFLVSDFYNTYMCVFSKYNTLFVFNPATTVPELVMEKVSKSEIVSAVSVYNINNDSNPFQLYFLNSEQELFCLRLRESLIDEEMANEMDPFVTPFSAQMSKISGGNVRKSISDYVPSKMKKKSHHITSIMDAPAHTLPNPLRLCSEFLENLTESVRKKEKELVTKEKLPDKEDITNIHVESNNVDEAVSEDLLWNVVNNLFIK